MIFGRKFIDFKVTVKLETQVSYKKTLKISSFILSDGMVKIMELNSAIMTGSGTALSTIGTPL